MPDATGSMVDDTLLEYGDESLDESRLQAKRMRQKPRRTITME